MSRDPIKVYDARWEAAEFSGAEVTRLFEATLLYGRELDADTVVFGRDARLAAAHVLELGIGEALRQGYRVFARAEPIGTPHGYFMTHWASQRHPRAMGLMITASHNPARYVGVKFVVPTVQAIGLNCGPAGGLRRVREIYHSGARAAGTPGGELHLLDLGREYVDFSLRAAGVTPGSLAGLTAVLDAFHGSAGPELHAALDRAGLKVHARRLLPDGNFPTGSPNPISRGKMDEAVAWCGQHGADLVIGVDGDGDRLVFGDRRGILTAGFAMLPVLQAMGVAGAAGAAGSPPAVLYDPKVSPLALSEWGRLGVRPVLFRNGHSQIKDYMRRIGAVAAAEESGHYYHRLTLGELTVAAENSLVTALLFLGALHRQRSLLDHLWELQRRGFTTGEFNYQFDGDARRDAAMAAAIAHFAGRGASAVSTTPDGIDLEGTVLARGVDLTPGQTRLDEGWYSGYLRVATNEKGVLRSYFSAGDEETGHMVERATRQLLEREFGGTVVE